MLRLLKADLLVTSDSPQLIEFGSCSLHVIHGGLKTGHKAVKWEVIEFLRASYYLFKDFPTRRGEYIRITGCKIFPAKFCTTRWVENENATTVALKILPHIRKYITEVKKVPNSKVFQKVKMYLEDPLLPAKLGFFQGLAHQLERFLFKYQADKPMVPFLHDDLQLLVKNILKRIVKKTVIDKTSNALDLMKIDLDKPGNIIMAKDLELFHSAKEGLRNTITKLPTATVLKFKEQCLHFFKVTVSKILERCCSGN
jgi:hypothetical protein